MSDVYEKTNHTDDHPLWRMSKGRDFIQGCTVKSCTHYAPIPDDIDAPPQGPPASYGEKMAAEYGQKVPDWFHWRNRALVAESKAEELKNLLAAQRGGQGGFNAEDVAKIMEPHWGAVQDDTEAEKDPEPDLSWGALVAVNKQIASTLDLIANHLFHLRKAAERSNHLKESM